MTKHEHHDCIVAWAAGATIQYFHNFREEWVTVHEHSAPAWSKNTKYRVKPEPVPDLVTYGIALITYTEDNVRRWASGTDATAVKVTIKTDENGKQTKTVEIME